MLMLISSPLDIQRMHIDCQPSTEAPFLVHCLGFLASSSSFSLVKSKVSLRHLLLYSTSDQTIDEKDVVSFNVGPIESRLQNDDGE